MMETTKQEKTALVEATRKDEDLPPTEEELEEKRKDKENVFVQVIHEGGCKRKSHLVVVMMVVVAC